MPKERKSCSQWLNESKEFQVLKDNLLFCKACGKSFKCEKKSHLTQHQISNLHKLNVNKGLRQTTVQGSSVDTSRSFNTDLCNALMAANIPWTKLSMPKLKEFLEKYCGRSIPNESNLTRCYEETIKNIQNEIGNSDIWICVDESTDRTGRYIANLVIGKLSDTEPGKPYLLASKPLITTNSTTVSRFINDSLGILWPNGLKYNRVKLLVSDAAAYMLKCGRDLKIFYPDLIHFTCLAHGLNLVCETIRNNFENINGLISNVKKVFLKAPLRVQHYKNALPDVPLPPEPILTRWGTWLKAAIFYADHFDEIKEVVLGLEATALCVEKAVFYFNCPNIKDQLIYIKANFKILIESINKLEAVGVPLTDSLAIVEKVINTLEQSGGEVANLALQKLKATINKNPGFVTLMGIKRTPYRSGEEKRGK
ncbi:unnamed protein product [Brassicogethes aeneus]|uniref:DUF659 domain-containing protein n=1 Tax=Brassicogethes aeneus TaxID=1431903 RepID=A0A9P0FE76_BRAAE|nr:unnamed protein product [Brassicogethes aeneus]